MRIVRLGLLLRLLLLLHWLLLLLLLLLGMLWMEGSVAAMTHRRILG
jgi:hypothetical protein